MPDAKKRAGKAIRDEMERELQHDLEECGKEYATTVALLFARAETYGMSKGQIIRLHFATLEALRDQFERVLKFEPDPPKTTTGN
jgi:hypothetical protein